MVMIQGECYYNDSRFHESVDCFDESLRNLSGTHYANVPKRDIARLIAAIHGSLGDLYFNLGNNDLAIIQFERQLSIGTELSSNKDLISAYLGLGKCFYENGDHNLARDQYMNALSECVFVNDKNCTILA